jgi:hypothetical protein
VKKSIGSATVIIIIILGAAMVAYTQMLSTTTETSQGQSDTSSSFTEPIEIEWSINIGDILNYSIVCSDYYDDGNGNVKDLDWNGSISYIISSLPKISKVNTFIDLYQDIIMFPKIQFLNLTVTTDPSLSIFNVTLPSHAIDESLLPIGAWHEFGSLFIEATTSTPTSGCGGGLGCEYYGYITGNHFRFGYNYHDYHSRDYWYTDLNMTTGVPMSGVWSYTEIIGDGSETDYYCSFTLNEFRHI